MVSSRQGLSFRLNVIVQVDFGFDSQRYLRRKVFIKWLSCKCAAHNSKSKRFCSFEVIVVILLQKQVTQRFIDIQLFFSQFFV